MTDSELRNLVNSTNLSFREFGLMVNINGYSDRDESYTLPIIFHGHLAKKVYNGIVRATPLGQSVTVKTVREVVQTNVNETLIRIALDHVSDRDLQTGELLRGSLRYNPNTWKCPSDSGRTGFSFRIAAQVKKEVK